MEKIWKTAKCFLSVFIFQYKIPIKVFNCFFKFIYIVYREVSDENSFAVFGFVLA